MSQCCVNITCRSINSCYFCSKSCKWLLRIKHIKNIFSAQSVEHLTAGQEVWIDFQSCTNTQGLKIQETEKMRYFSYPANFSPLNLFLLLPHFFSFAGHLVGFILVEKFLGKLLGTWHQRKQRYTSRWVNVVKQDFHGNSQVNVLYFCLFLWSPPLICACSGMV